MSCEKKLDTIMNADILTLPSLTGENIQTVWVDSGKVQLVMSTPLIEKYSNTDDPYSEFRSGLHIEFHDGQKDPIAFATSKYAKFLEKKNLWELKDSVVIINEAGEKLETEQLFWDQEKDHIYTDRFVKITREDQTIMGTGFESDSRLLSPVIKHVTATIYLRDE
jgi:LPS export ABC transporter protein LptC